MWVLKFNSVLAQNVGRVPGIISWFVAVVVISVPSQVAACDTMETNYAFGIVFSRKIHLVKKYFLHFLKGFNLEKNILQIRWSVFETSALGHLPTEKYSQAFFQKLFFYVSCYGRTNFR